VNRVAEDGSRSTPRWAPSWVRNALRILPVALCVAIGAGGYVLRPGGGALELGGVGVLFAVTWVVSSRDPLLLCAIAFLGIDVAVTTSGHSMSERDLVAFGAGSVLYLVHASAALSAALRGQVQVDVRVLLRWLRRTMPVASTAVAGLVATSTDHLAGEERRLLVLGAVVAGIASLALIWFSRGSAAETPNGIPDRSVRAAK
jgi:hypothetical protein